MECEDVVRQLMGATEQVLGFDDEREHLEKRIITLEEVRVSMQRALDVPRNDAETQANPRVKSGSVQTDLSYQYLEHAEDLQTGPKRADRVARLKEAGHFVDEEGEGRDFQAQVHSSVYT